MPRRPIAPFRDAIAHLKTGDLVFCRGRMWSSRLIEFLTGGVWSHVAMVVEPKDIDPDSSEEGLYLWESTSIPGKDVAPDIADGKTGPMLVKLEERMEEYLTEKGYKLLSVRYLHVERTQELRDRIAAFVEDREIRNAEYPQEWQILWYFFRERFLTGRREGTFYCSELVAATYQAGGLLPPSPSPQSYCPRDFSETGFVPRLLRSELGQELYMGDV